MSHTTRILYWLAAGAALGAFGWTTHLVAAPLANLNLNGPAGPITVGQSFLVDVELSGLEPGQELDSLAATVTFDAALLRVLSVDPGTILPDPPYQPTDFLTATGPGLADASFLTLGTAPDTHIASDGVFYTVTAEALAPGLASINFDFVDATQFNPTDPNDPMPAGLGAGGSFEFTILIPEPGTVLLGAIALVFALPRRFQLPFPCNSAVPVSLRC